LYRLQLQELAPAVQLSIYGVDLKKLLTHHSASLKWPLSWFVPLKIKF